MTAFLLSSIRIPVVYLFDRRSDPSVSFIVSRIDSGYSRHRGHNSHQNRNQCHKTDRSNSNNNTKFHVYLLRRPAACLNSLHIFPYTEQKNNLLHSKRAYTVINKMYMKKKAVTGGGKPDFPCRDLPPIPPGKCFSPKKVSAITESRFRPAGEVIFQKNVPAITESRFRSRRGNISIAIIPTITDYSGHSIEASASRFFSSCMCSMASSSSIVTEHPPSTKYWRYQTRNV